MASAHFRRPPRTLDRCYAAFPQRAIRDMSRRVTIIGFVLFVLVVAGLLLTYIPKARLKANMVASQNNLRELSLFAAHHANPDPRRDAGKLPGQIPAGTVYL